MHVFSMHVFKSSELAVSTQPMNIRMEENTSKVKKNLWLRMPIEFLCHTIIPSFLA